MKSRKLTKKDWWLLPLVLMVWGSIWFIFQPTSADIAHRKSIDELTTKQWQEYSALNPPRGAKFRRTWTYTKDGWDWGSTVVWLQDSPPYEVIKLHYLKEMPAHGWVLKNENEFPGNNRMLVFCKDRMKSEVFYTANQNEISLSFYGALKAGLQLGNSRDVSCF